MLSSAHAQQEARFTHYAFNTLSVNPAYAGGREALTITGLHRSQWVNFTGAPTTQTVTAHAPIFNGNLGLGLTIMNDQIGSISDQGVMLDVAYRLKLGKGHLCFGLKGGVSFYSNRITDLYKKDESDPILGADIQSNLLPVFGAGLYYQSKKFFVGVSSPRMLERAYDNDVVSGNSTRHYYLISGGRFNLSSDSKWELQPTAFLKFLPGVGPQLDLTALVHYNQRFWFGPMFRTEDAYGALLGVNLTPQFALGYSYDRSFGLASGTYNSGSHEIMLRYDFVFQDKGKIVSPRYF